MPRADGAHDEGRRQVAGQHHMHETIGEGRVEHDLPPVDRNEAALRVDGVAGRRVGYADLGTEAVVATCIDLLISAGPGHFLLR